MRSIPARSFRASISPNPASCSRSPTAPACPAPTSRATQPLWGGLARNARIASRPSGPASSASRGSHCVTSGSRDGHVGLAHVGQVGEDEVELSVIGDRALEEANPVGETEPLGVGAGDFQRRRGGIGGGDRAVSGSSSATASAIAPEPVPTSSSRAGRSSSASSTSSSVSGRGISTRGSTASSIRRKPRRPSM